MANCPNKNLEEWKLLAASRGEDVAYYLWDKYSGHVPESESRSEIVKSGLKATNILQSIKADQFFGAVAKNKITGDFFWKKMQADLGIPKDQLEILKLFNTQDRGELISSLLANYSYAVEINTAKERDSIAQQEANRRSELFTEEELNDTERNTGYYSNLTVPGGTNYTENEISTPLITPSIKGHAQFATDNGIGWFRSDEEVTTVKEERVYNPNYMPNFNPMEMTDEEINEIVERGLHKAPNETFITTYNGSKTRRILEVQSDLYQKGRNLGDIEQIIKDLQKSGDLKIDCN